MTKEKLKDLLLLVKQFDGNLTLSYIPKSKIYSVEEVYNLYYSGWNKIEIGLYYNSCEECIEMSNSNIDIIVDKIYDKLTDSVGEFIIPALNNLGLDDVYLKYFDREPELFIKFQEEVLRLKQQKQC